MFGRSRRDSNAQRKREKYMNSQLAREMAQIAFGFITSVIKERYASGNLDLLGASTTIEIKFIGGVSCEISAIGVRRSVNIPYMEESEYQALTEAVGFIVASATESFLHDRFNISCPYVGVYTNHAPYYQVSVSVIYGDVCDDSGCIR